MNMLRTMKAKALTVGGESAIKAAMEEMTPTGEQEEQSGGGKMTERINEK